MTLLLAPAFSLVMDVPDMDSRDDSLLVFCRCSLFPFPKGLLNLSGSFLRGEFVIILSWSIISVAIAADSCCCCCAFWACCFCSSFNFHAGTIGAAAGAEAVVGMPPPVSAIALNFSRFDLKSNRCGCGCGCCCSSSSCGGLF